MKKQLVAGMYRFVPEAGLFGLICGQLRPPGQLQLAERAGWYNEDGQRLGYGDLDAIDLQQISREIDSDETFYLVQEEYSLSPRDADESLLPLEEPGQLFVSNHAFCMIRRGEIRVFFERATDDHLDRFRRALPEAKVVCLDA